MVGDDKEVERPDQAGAGAAGRHDHLALGEAQRLVGAQPVADHAGIGRVRGMEVGVAPEHLVRMRLIQVGRVLLTTYVDVFLTDGDILRRERHGQAEDAHGGSGNCGSRHDIALPLIVSLIRYFGNSSVMLKRRPQSGAVSGPAAHQRGPP